MAHALRRLRPDCYRIDAGPTGPLVSLTMRASEAGRRNGAAKIVSLLADHGLRLDRADGADPVEALTASDRTRLVVRRGGAG